VVKDSKYTNLHNEVDFFGRFSVIDNDDYDLYLEKKIGDESLIMSK